MQWWQTDINSILVRYMVYTGPKVFVFMNEYMILSKFRQEEAQNTNPLEQYTIIVNSMEKINYNIKQ